MNKKNLLLQFFWPTILESIPEKGQKQSRNWNCNSFGIRIHTALVSMRIFDESYYKIWLDFYKSQTIGTGLVPQRWGDAVLAAYNGTEATNVPKHVESSVRWRQNAAPYDAYEEDIAEVVFFFNRGSIQLDI